MLFVVIGLSGARWWQDHKAQQEEISTMADQSSAELNGGDANSQNVPLDTSAPAARPPIAPRTARQPIPPAHRPPARRPRRQRIITLSWRLPSQCRYAGTTPAAPATTPASPLPTDQANVTTPAASAQDLVMNFSADCWLEVSDATGKNCSAACSVKAVT